MKIKTVTKLLLIFLLFGSVGFADVIYTEKSCHNSTTLVTHTFVDNGTANVTTNKDFENCGWLCEESIGVCSEPNDIIFHGFLIQIGYLIIIGGCLACVGLLRDEHGAMKFLFLSIALIFMWAMLFNTAVVSTDAQIESISDSGTSALSIADMFTWIMYVIFIYFILRIIINALLWLRDSNKKRRKKYSWI